MSGERFGPRFTGLSGLQPQISMRSDGEKWKGAFEATREVTAEQGQVMGAALDNNKNLWETNKVLRREMSSYQRAAEDAQWQVKALRKQLEESSAGELVAEIERLRAANKALLHQLTLSLYPEMSVDERKDALQRMKDQAAELKASGLVPTPEQIQEHDARLDEKYGVFNDLPGETPAQYAARVKAARRPR
jgi:hypothetical protein